MKKILVSALLVLFGIFLSFGIAAETEAKGLSLSSDFPLLTDKSEEKAERISEEFTIDAEEELDSIYLIFYTEPVNFILSAGGVEKTVSASFLRQYVSITELFGKAQKSITITFEKEAKLLEIYGFSGEIPSWVQIWEAPCEKADLCLFSTHSDDEHLFFAGILPYYAGEKDYAVQVIYFTDHINQPLRRHELLNGLWTVGVKNYPVISSFPDRYSKSEELTLDQFEEVGYSYDDLLSFQVEMIRRFRPLVVIGHDPFGEYGHGQHIVNSKSLREAVLEAGKEETFPESAERYGVYEVPKTYLHLYSENQITMDWDSPLSSFGGKTAYEMSKLGFSCHVSQHDSWFYEWLNGKNDDFTESTQIKSYSPNSYGLFRSLVGEDVLKNDFFENQLSYGEMEEIARKEQEEKEKEEAERLEKEKLKQEEEKRLKEEAVRKETEEKENQRKEKIICVFIFISLALALSILSFFIIGKLKKNK